MAYLLDKDPLCGEFKKVIFEPSADFMLKDSIESQQGDFFKRQQEYFCETFNPDNFKKKISPILDRAIEENQKCEKQMQDYVKLLKNTTFGKALFKEI